MFDELEQPVVADRVEKPGNVGVQNPVHRVGLDSHREGIQRIVLAASRPEPVAEPEEVFLVDRVQYFDQRTLDDLVLDGSDAERALAPVRFWYVLPSCRLRAVTPAMNTVVQIGKAPVQIDPVVVPGHAVHSGCCIPF